MDEENDDDDYFIGEGYGVCPMCGGPTITCVVADNACTKCDYVETYYENTAYN